MKVKAIDVKRLRSSRMGEIPPRWVVLVGLVMLFALTAVAFVDYEMTRADAVTARSDAEIARARCFSTSPASISERERRNARCERLIPVPARAADQVERRWDRRGPWYGLTAGAILVPSVLFFARSRRRRPASATVDASANAVWHVMTIAVEIAVGILVWLALYHLAKDRWTDFVQATGGSTHDCHYPAVDCGVLGEFSTTHSEFLLWLFRVGAAILSLVSVWLLSRLFRSLGDQGDRTRHMRFRKPDSQSVPG
jgi:hypothetical protein